MRIRAEIAQSDKRLATGILNFDTSRGSFMGNKHLVFRILSELDHGWSL